MPNRNDKNLGNVQGKFYVDSTCVDCDLCRNTAPIIFCRNDETGMTFVFHQPESDDELALANDAMAGCPTESIGNNG